MKMIDLKKFKLPDSPGVYFFLGRPKPIAEGGKKGNPPSHKATAGRRTILYIGKATSLRDRTKSYFSKDLIATRGPAILDMVVQADKVEYQETDSVLEALILEAELIKKHQPKYNTKENEIYPVQIKKDSFSVYAQKKYNALENFDKVAIKKKALAQLNQELNKQKHEK